MAERSWVLISHSQHEQTGVFNLERNYNDFQSQKVLFFSSCLVCGLLFSWCPNKIFNHLPNPYQPTSKLLHAWHEHFLACLLICKIVVKIYIVWYYAKLLQNIICFFTEKLSKGDIFGSVVEQREPAKMSNLFHVFVL